MSAQPSAADTVSYQPWVSAKERFVAGLSEHERTLFERVSIENIYYTASNAQKKHEESSKLRKISRQLQPLTKALDEYGQALDVLSNSFSLYICPVWGGVRVILSIVQNFEKYCDKILDMLARIGDILPRLREYQALFADDTGLLEALTNTYLVVLHFCCEVKYLFLEPSRSSFKLIKKSQWKSAKQNFERYLEELRRHRENVVEHVALVHMRREQQFQAEYRAHRQQDLARAKKDERVATLNRISDLDYQHKHRTVVGMRNQKTCEWLLNDVAFRQWEEDAQNCCLMIWGIPGCGKTIQVSSVIEHMRTIYQKQDEMILYHYCDYSDQRTLNSSNIAKSLVRQILDKKSFSDSLFERLEKLSSEKGPSWIDDEELLRICLCSLRRYMVVLDGIDELSGGERTKFHYKLSKILKENKNVKVLVSCRKGELQLGQRFPVTHHLDITKDKVADDLRRYIEDEIEEACNAADPERKLVIQAPALKRLIIDKLFSKASGMFLWAKFQIEDLRTARNDFEIRQKLENLPEDLVQTYRRVIMGVLASGDGEHKLKTCKRIFIWLLYAKRPLSLDEVREGITIDQSDKRLHPERLIEDDAKLIGGCRSLVVIDETDKTMTFAHSTIKQALEQEKLVNVVGKLHGEECIGRICMQYLAFEDFERRLTANRPMQMGILAEAAQHALPSNALANIASKVHKWIWKPDPPPMQTTTVNPASLQLPSNTSDLASYALLDYAIKYWHEHTRTLSYHTSSQYRPLFQLCFEAVMPFEFRPWVHEEISEEALSINEEFSAFFSAFGSPNRDARVFAWMISNGHCLLLGLYTTFLSQEIPPYFLKRMMLLACRQGHCEFFLKLRSGIAHANFTSSVNPEEIDSFYPPAAAHSFEMLNTVYTACGRHTAALDRLFELGSFPVHAATNIINVLLHHEDSQVESLACELAAKLKNHEVHYISAFEDVLAGDYAEAALEPTLMAAVRKQCLPLLFVAFDHDPNKYTLDKVCQAARRETDKSPNPIVRSRFVLFEDLLRMKRLGARGMLEELEAGLEATSESELETEKDKSEIFGTLPQRYPVCRSKSETLGGILHFARLDNLLRQSSARLSARQVFEIGHLLDNISRMKIDHLDDISRIGMQNIDTISHIDIGNHDTPANTCLSIRWLCLIGWRLSNIVGDESAFDELMSYLEWSEARRLSMTFCWFAVWARLTLARIPAVNGDLGLTMHLLHHLRRRHLTKSLSELREFEEVITKQGAPEIMLAYARSLPQRVHTTEVEIVGGHGPVLHAPSSLERPEGEYISKITDIEVFETRTNIEGITPCIAF